MRFKGIFLNKKKLYLGLTLIAYSLFVYTLSDMITGIIGTLLLFVSIYLLFKSVKNRTKKGVPVLLLLIGIHTLNVTEINVPPAHITTQIESNRKFTERKQNVNTDKNKDESNSKASNVSSTTSINEEDNIDKRYDDALKAINETIDKPSRSNLESAVEKVNNLSSDKQEITDKLNEAEKLVIDEEAKKDIVKEKIKLAEEELSRTNYDSAITSFEELLIYDNQLKKRLNIIRVNLTEVELSVEPEKEETEQVEESAESFDVESEYNEAQLILDDILNNAYSDIGYWEYNETTYSFVFTITDQELITSIGLIMDGQAPDELWSQHMTSGLLELSESIGYTYGYGNFALEVRNPYNQDYTLLEVADGFIVYDFIDEL